MIWPKQTLARRRNYAIKLSTSALAFLNYAPRKVITEALDFVMCGHAVAVQLEPAKSNKI